MIEHSLTRSQEKPEHVQKWGKYQPEKHYIAATVTDKEEELFASITQHRRR
jgi:hypothetical protein